MDIRRRKPSREHRETDAGAASAPRHGAGMWPHANAAALRAERGRMQARLPPCARFALTAGVPRPNLREEVGLPVAKTTADLYKLAHVGGTVLCTAGECSCLNRRSRPRSVFFFFFFTPCTLQCRQEAESAQAEHAI